MNDAIPPARLIRTDLHRILRDEILRCTLRPGAELRERELAARFEVSKSPVREALLRLEREGLVIVLPRQGYRVAPVSLSDAKDMFELRLVLEHACIGAAMRDADDAAFAALDPYRVYDGGADAEAFVRYNSAFHAALAEASGNARMAEVTRALIDHMDRLVRLSLGVDSGAGRDHGRLVAEHRAIIDAIQGRDGRLARRLLRLHIAEAQKRVIKALAWNMVTP